jgi:transcription factor MYB, plant
MMFVRSGCTIFKAREKCREQWTNHLFPGLRKGSWSKQEDLQLFQTVKEYGKKWSVISKLFKGARSEHMVKNRYNSLIHKTKKKWHQGSQQDWEERSIKLL